MASAQRQTVSILSALIVLAGLFAASGLALAQTGHSAMHQRMHGHGAAGMGHDETTMPGLRGLNATPEESEEIAVLFRQFRTLSREVENLPNGIRTITRSSDPAVSEALVSHVVGMIGRVETKDDPQIMIQSPTLDIFFARGDAFETEIEITDDGVVVVQTAEDPALVAALHEHAAEVTAMVDQGMHAVHQMMMQRARN